MTEKFTCEACGTELTGGASVIECTHCKRSHCDECLSDEGVCEPCRD